jgi:hypothetical protein
VARGHDTISFALSEFANFAAAQAEAVSSDGNTIITAADRDSVKLIDLASLSTAMSGDFTFHT